MNNNGKWQNRIVRTAMVDPEQLLAHPLNYRVHPKHQQDALQGSLDELGWYKRVVVQDQTDVVIDGHARVTLALRHNEPLVPVDYVDFTDEETNLALATGDPISALAEFDKQQFDALLHDTTTAEPALQELLSRLAENEGLYYGDEPPQPADDPGAQIDRAEELREKWQTERGQLWEIPSLSVPGRSHRLLCGDSTSAEDVARLMSGERIGAVFTSPPYDQQRTYEGNMASDWDELMAGVFVQTIAHANDDAQIFVNLGLIHRDGRVIRYWDSFITWMESHGWPLFGWYVWDKIDGMPGDWNGRLAPSHEWIFHFSRTSIRPEKTVRAKRAGDSVERSQRNPDGSLKRFTGERDPIQPFKIPDSVIRCAPQKPDSIINNHPAPFPVGVPLVFTEAWSIETWYEPFTGSATSFVAAEQTGRLCYGCEIEPKYVAVALERLSGLGLFPRLVSDE